MKKCLIICAQGMGLSSGIALNPISRGLGFKSCVEAML